MDYKDKLKLAKEALDSGSYDKETIEYIFPELAESDDESIRKEIYNALRYLETELSWDALGRVDILDAYAWLEKQGQVKESEISQHENKTCKENDDSLTDDERIRKELMEFLFGNRIICNDLGGINIDKTLTWLKKQCKQKPKWTEEDECYMSECIGAIATKDGWSFEEKRKTKHWLKSLKKRMEEQQ